VASWFLLRFKVQVLDVILDSLPVACKGNKTVRNILAF